MAVDTFDPRIGEATANELPLSYPQPDSSAFYRTTVIHSGLPATGTWTIPIADSVEDREEEEREWHSIVSKPHVRAALRRMAEEARREYYAGEFEDGGFALE